MQHTYIYNMHTGHLFINDIIRVSLCGSYDSDIHCLNRSLPDPLSIFIVNLVINFGQRN